MQPTENMSKELDPKPKREQYFNSLEAFIKLYSLQDNEHSKEQIKKRIKELLPGIYQPGILRDDIELSWASGCTEKIMKTCQIEECEELLAIIDLENKRPLFYSLLEFFCAEPERYAPLIKKLAPKAYFPKNDFEYEKTTDCMYQLISSSHNEIHCLELIKAFPLGKTQFEPKKNSCSLFHLLVEKNFKRIIKELLYNLDFHITDQRGWTALHIAANYTQDISMVQLLLDLGISPLIRTKPTPGNPKEMLASDLVHEKIKISMRDTTKDEEIYNLLIESEQEEKKKLKAQAPKAFSSTPLQPSPPLKGHNGSPSKVSRSRSSSSLFAPGKENDDPTLPLLSCRSALGHSQSE